MSTIQQNLTRLQNAKTAIATAITNKGGTVSTGDGFEDFASEIEAIPTTSSKLLEITIQLTSSTLNPYFLVDVSSLGECSIDWGDGFSNDIITPQSGTYQGTPHTYASAGTYTITVNKLTSCVIYITGGYYKSYLISDNTWSSGGSAYTNTIRSVTMYKGSLLNSEAFKNCRNMTTCVLPDDLRYISVNCFYYCDNLIEITIPQTVANIGGSAFSYNSKLSNITFLSATPPTCSSGAFTALPTTCKIHIPAGTLSAYTSAANYPSASTYTYIEDA